MAAVEEKNPTREVILTRVFDASRERVWKAWADPAQLAQWWGPKGVINPVCEVDLRAGGAIHVVMLAGEELGPFKGQRWPMKGIFLEVVEPEKLVFTNNALAEDGMVMLEGETTVLLEDQDVKTKLTLTARATGRVPQAPQMLAGMEQGWSEGIDKLGALLAH